MVTQPFWTSKTFWALALGLLALLAKNIFGLDISSELIATVMGILALIFRWTADQPLSVK